jgi:DNA-binding response OmpR family regulator
MKKILIVEDDPEIARALAVRLEANHYEVAVANDAALAMNLLVRNQPDLVLLDILLPSGNGFLLAERGRELVIRLPPIIVITGSKSPGLREKATRVGAAAFFEKPFESEALLAAIRTALNDAPPPPPGLSSGGDELPGHQSAPPCA